MIPIHTIRNNFRTTRFTVQPKLSINSPGDQYEQEADTVADRVMRMSVNKHSIKQVTGIIGTAVQRKCAACEEEDKKKQVMRKVEGGGAGVQASFSLQSSLAASRGGGSSLPANTKGFMETAFSRDFSRVRIHTGNQASEMNKNINAKAFTYGRDIYFNEGQFSPQTNEGKKLLAHELTHVLQQTGVSGTLDPTVSHTLYRQPLPGFRPKHSSQIARLLGSELLDNFTLEGYTLTEEHKQRLTFHATMLLDLLREYPGGIISITGHTDATGSEAFNDKLGQQRADTVMNFLIDLGVPANAFISSGKGESQLLTKTSGPEGNNRRVEVRFILSPLNRSLGVQVLTPPQEPTKVRRPDLTYKPADSPGVFGDAAKSANCGSATECSASSQPDFDKLPGILRNLIKRSNPHRSESQWFNTTLDSGLRDALTTVYMRLCKYRLLCYLHSITKIEPGERTAEIPFIGLIGLSGGFSVPGKTASIYFTVTSGPAMLQALIGTGNFCVDGSVSGLLHKGSTSLREISTTDSLHVSIKGNDVDAHIDKYAPIPEHPAGIFCPGAPTPAALKHIGQEVVPEFARRYLGIPGFTVFPDPIGKSPIAEPEGTRGNDFPPSIVGITLRGPVRLPPKRKAIVTLLPDDTEASLAELIPRLVDNDSLVPPSAKRRLIAATKAAEEAGPDEEAALKKAKFDAQSNLDSFASEAHYFAQDMARRMGDAKRKNSSGFVVELGEAYNKLGTSEIKIIHEKIRQIAVIVRKLLGDHAAGINKIWIKFGGTMRDFTF